MLQVVLSGPFNSRGELFLERNVAIRRPPRLVLSVLRFFASKPLAGDGVIFCVEFDA